MFSLLCFGLLLVGIHGINEIRPQQPHIEVFDVPGDPFSSLPKVNLDDKECNLQEYTKEYKKAIKEWQEKYQKLAKSNNAEVNAFFKQFIQEFAYRISFKYDDISEGFNRTAVIAFSSKDITLLKEYLSKTNPTKSL
uniref:Uncharacterized protein n=1 Tax=Panagrolaimus sp. ES5 TaxID=591445 RepID=A0AC34EZU4_9BILA